MASSSTPSYLPQPARSHSTSAPIEILSESLPSSFDCPPPHPHPTHSYWTKHFHSELTRWNWGGYGGIEGDEGDRKSSESWDMIEDSSAWGKGAKEREIDSDICVIGTGLTGCSVVDTLVEELTKGDSIEKKKRVRIIVLEAREFCSGATARNGGHLTPSPRYTFSTLSTDAGSIEDAVKSIILEDRGVRNVVERCKKEGWTKDVDLVEGGALILFASEEQEMIARKEVASAESAGVDVSSLHWIDSDEAKSKYGAQCHAALEVAGNNLYPLKYVTKLFQRAQARASASKNVELQLYTGTPVLRMEKVTEKSGVRWRLNTERGTVLATQVIHCTNAYASSLLPSLRSGPARIIPVRGQIIAVSPPSPQSYWSNGFMAREGHEYYFQRPLPLGEIILGGCRDAAGEANGWEMNEVDDGGLERSGQVGKSLRKYLGWQFPDYGFESVEKGEGVTMEWTGIMGYRESGVPIVGHVYEKGEKLEGQFISAGYTGHGMPRAPACGEFIALMALAEWRKEEFVVPEWMPKFYLSRAEEGRVEPARRWCAIS